MFRHSVFTTKTTQLFPQVISHYCSICWQLCCTVDVIFHISQNSSKFGRQYPRYQRFFLVCAGELRFVGHRSTLAQSVLIYRARWTLTLSLICLSNRRSRVCLLNQKYLSRKERCALAQRVTLSLEKQGGV